MAHKNYQILFIVTISILLDRYQFFLQLKQDLLEGRIEYNDKKAIELCGLALQCKRTPIFDFITC